VKNTDGVYRYGKSMADVFSIKKNFFEENDTLSKNGENYSKLYRQQRRRDGCKICLSSMPSEKYFTNHGTDYFLCDTCGHLNGEFDDGIEYTKALYESGLYGTDYQESDPIRYLKRMDAIYAPKVRFMVDSFHEMAVIPESLKYLDIGAGTGFMSCALDRVGLDVIGVEVSEKQVSFANKMIGKDLLKVEKADCIVNMIRGTDREVLVFINVFEHITNLNEVLESIQGNKRIQYLYFCVPLLSLTCAFETIFPEIFARHIGGGGGHTHLFSHKSLDWIFQKYGFMRVATWIFGTDIMDLYRSIIVMLEMNGSHPDFIKSISTLFSEQADAIQLIIDKGGFASDIHIIAKVR
jgi:hypothetical protein